MKMSNNNQIHLLRNKVQLNSFLNGESKTNEALHDFTQPGFGAIKEQDNSKRAIILRH